MVRSNRVPIKPSRFCGAFNPLCDAARQIDATVSPSAELSCVAHETRAAVLPALVPSGFASRRPSG